jgi:hypothetical protein
MNDMSNEFVNEIIEGCVMKDNVLYRETPEEKKCADNLYSFLNKIISPDKFMEFEPLLTNLEYEIERNALSIGFKLGMNLMTECRVSTLQQKTSNGCC